MMRSKAVLAGFAAGSDGTDLTIRAICSAMRNADNSLAVAQAAVGWRDQGVVAFDIAGAEDGFPPDDHIRAFQFCQRENFHITVHAGEAYGPRSIWKAVQYCGSERLGHGIRIVEDIEHDEHGEPKLSRLAHFLRDRRIPLEICPTSNVNTGVFDSIAAHTHRSTHQSEIPGDPQYRQSVDVGGVDEFGDGRAGRCFRLRLGSASLVDGQRDEVELPTLSANGCSSSSR